MASAKLPKRFQPLLQQAATQTDLQYGPQEAALQSILSQRTNQYSNDLGAAQTAHLATQALLGQEPAAIQKAYSDAGLTPSLIQSLGNSPTGQRIASEMASAQAAVPTQQTGESAGWAYQQQHLSDQLGQDVNSIQGQAQALAKARGEYSSSLLDQLISSDRSARHDANQQIRDQAFTADQNAAKDQSSLTNTVASGLLGQGLQPVINSDGSVSVGGVIPGGKADPSSPQYAGKAKTKTPTPSKPNGADRDVQKDFTKATSWIKQLDNPKTIPDPAKRREAIREILIKGDQVAGYPSIPGVGLDAALDMYFNKSLTPQTVTALHNSGVKVKFLGNGVQTQQQQTQSGRILHRPGTAPSRAQQPG